MHKFSSQNILDIGYGQNRQKFNINFSTLVGIYMLPGEDVTSAFKRDKK